MIITTLRPVLLSHTVTLIINADKDGSVSVTAFLKNKDKNGKDHSVQLVGSHEELDEGLIQNMMATVQKVTESTATLADLDAQIAETKKEKEALLKAEKAAADAAKKKSAGKDAPDPKKNDDKGKTKEPVVTRNLPKAPPKPAATPAPASANLVPATPPPAPATEPGTFDLGI